MLPFRGCRPSSIGFLLVLFVLQRAAIAQDLHETRLTHYMEQAEIPGLSIAAFSNTDIKWETALGVKDVETREPVTGQTVFEAASLSKPVVAYVLMRLVDRGEFDLDQPLWDLLEYDRLAHDERAKRITARMVLTHTSGLPNWGGTPLELNRDPGERWGYSGEGFVYLQRVIETAIGAPLNEIVRQEVFLPLEMQHSSFVWEDRFSTMAASGHDFMGDSRNLRRQPDANAAASLITTASDYARFMRAILAGEGLSPETHSAMMKAGAQVVDWNSGSPVDFLSWGLGWGLQEGKGRKAIWHWGDNGAFRSFVIAYPDRGTGVVYFTNSEHGLSIVDEVLNMFYGGEEWPATKWLGYWNYDDSARLARLRLRRAFLDDVEAGRRVLDEVRSDTSEVIDVDEMGNLALFLSNRDRSEESIFVIEMAKEWFSNSPEVYESAGEVYVSVRRYEDALKSYRQAIQVDPNREQRLEKRIAWLEEGLAAEGYTVDLTTEQMDRYVGEYGPRVITRVGDELLYRREGSVSPTRMIPMPAHVFALESAAGFRIRFVFDGAGRSSKIVGLYADGSTDETMRTEDTRD